MEQESTPPLRVIVEQGTADPETLAALLERAKELGAHVLPYEIASGAEVVPPAYLTQGDFVKLAGDDRTQQRLANLAWIETARGSKKGGFPFEPAGIKGVRTTGLVFAPFAERVRRMQGEVGSGISLRSATQQHLGRAVREDRFDYWVRVVDHFSPPQSPIQ